MKSARATGSLADPCFAPSQQESNGVNGIFTDWPCQNAFVIFENVMTGCDVIRLPSQNTKLKGSVCLSVWKEFQFKNQAIPKKNKNNTYVNNYQHLQLSPFQTVGYKYVELQKKKRKKRTFTIFCAVKAPFIKVAWRQESENNERK